MKSFTKNLIAPCGMNCGICKAHLRENNPCHGCREAQKNQPKTRTKCKLRICRKRPPLRKASDGQASFCFQCKDFPCERLKHLDMRYRMKYGMSEIANLKYIRDFGMKKFLNKERRKWISKKGIFCVHDKKCYPIN